MDRRRKNGQHQDLCRVFAKPGTSGHSPELPARPELPAFDNIDQPGCANYVVRPEPARNPPRTFRPSELPASPDLSAPGRQPSSTRTNFLVKPDPARTFRRPELPALPACSHLGRGPCTLSSRKLYILLHLLLVRVSIGLAHISCESPCPSTWYFSSELTTSSEKIPQADSRPLQGKTIKTSSRRRTVPFVSSPC